MTVIPIYTYSWALGNHSAYKIASLADFQQKLGASQASWAFVVAGSGTAGLNAELDQDLADIQSFVKSGGELVLSWGGQSGPFVEDGVTDPQALFEKFDGVVQRTGVSAYDFDVEGSRLTDDSQNRVRAQAIALLQQKYPNFYISYTLPVMPSGLCADGLQLLQRNIEAGVEISIVNLMTMDFGGDFVEQDQGPLCVQAAEAVRGQLAQLYPNLSSQAIYGMIGLTPMIGVNDTGERFSVADAQLLASYAKQNGIGLISYWAIQRDQVGTGSLNLYSRLNTADFQYFNTFKSGIDVTSISGSSGVVPSPQPSPKPTPGPEPSPQPSPTPPEPTPLSAPAWKPWTLYKTDNLVSYNGVVYKCRQSHRSQPDWMPPAVLALWEPQ